MGSMGAESIVQTVVGGVGVAGSVYGAVSQADAMNDMMQQGRGTMALQEGISQYFLGGGKASGLDVPGFRDQFSEIDYALQEQQRRIGAQARSAQQMISENIPPGGAKLRALAELSMKTQDEKGKAVRESQSRKRDLDVNLTNQYTQQAMQQKYGPSQDARLWSTQKDYEGMVNNFGAMSKVAGDITQQALGSGQVQHPMVGYDPYKEATKPMAYQYDLDVMAPKKETDVERYKRKGITSGLDFGTGGFK